MAGYKTSQLSLKQSVLTHTTHTHTHTYSMPLTTLLPFVHYCLIRNAYGVLEGNLRETCHLED